MQQSTSPDGSCAGLVRSPAARAPNAPPTRPTRLPSGRYTLQPTRSGRSAIWRPTPTCPRTPALPRSSTVSELDAIQADRAAGVLLGQACGDALGVPYEFRRTLTEDEQPAMIGGGLGP